MYEITRLVCWGDRLLAWTFCSLVKVLLHSQFILISTFFNLLLCFYLILDPQRQFVFVAQHIENIRKDPNYRISPIFIYVERNLGFEAEHHKRALDDIPGVKFYIDQKSERVGVLTTETIKHAMVQLVNVMLSENRLHVANPLISSEPVILRSKLREQMDTYSYQLKLAVNTFQKDKIALSGKVGGCKDDLCICLQLACYFTQLEDQRVQQCMTLSK